MSDERGQEPVGFESRVAKWFGGALVVVLAGGLLAAVTMLVVWILAWMWGAMF